MKPLDYTQQSRLRIALFLATRGIGASELQALKAEGRLAGMNGAEMTANENGTSHDAQGTTCLLFVKALLDNKGYPPLVHLKSMEKAGFTKQEIAGVIAQVGAAMGLPDPATAVADSEIVNCDQSGSRQRPPD